MPKPLYLFERVDAQGKIIAGSGVYRQKQPKVGRWTAAKNGSICCAPATILALPVLASSSITTTGFVVSWTAITGADQYIMQTASDSAFTTVVNNKVLTTPTGTLTGLTTGTAYYVRVKALNSAGTLKDSPYTTALTVTTA